MSSTPTNSKELGTSPNSPVANWDRIIHKNVRSADNEPVGQVIALPDNQPTIVITTQGSRGEYLIPRSAVQGFNGAEVFLKLNAAELGKYRVKDGETYEGRHSEILSGQQTPPTTAAPPQKPKPKETKVPVIEERLKASKISSTEEAVITKEPITETKTIEVPVTHEEIVIERRPATSQNQISKEDPAKGKQQLKVSLSREEIEVVKEPIVKEEIVVKKKPVTETKKVTDTVRKEKVTVTDSKGMQQNVA